MTIRNLQFLFKPKSVALIGASKQPGSVGALVARNLFRSGFDGPIMPVNPKHDAIEGVLAYPDVASLPLVPDLAVIATPPETVPGIVADLGGARHQGRGRDHRRLRGRQGRRAAPSCARRCSMPASLSSCASSGPTASASWCRASASTPASRASIRCRGASPSSRSRARSSPPRSTGRRRAASASRTWSRSATWPTSTSATCSTTWPTIRETRGDPALRRDDHPRAQVHVGGAAPPRA